MRRLIPNFSDWFASWVSAGQYSSVEELELDTDVLPASKVRLFTSNTKPSTPAAQAPRRVERTRTRWG